MTVIEQSTLLPYSDRQMFDLVTDIESYPHFMDGCQDAQVISQHDNIVTARLELGKAGITYAFSTRNYLDPPRCIDMELVEGPFRSFDAHWEFNPLGDKACKVSLFMKFEFNNTLINVALKRVFDASSRNLVNAVTRRAKELYG